MSMMGSMGEFEDENRHQRVMYLEETLKTKIVRSSSKNVVRSCRRLQIAQKAEKKHGVLTKVACQEIGIRKSCSSCVLKFDAANAEIANWQMRLADNHRTWGFLPVLPVSTRCEMLRMRGAHQRGSRAQFSNQAAQAAGALQARGSDRAKNDQSLWYWVDL